jgi:Pentapeptide repeats (8 copies)
LERIARDSERDHWPIMEILSAYIRQNARYDPQNAPYRSDGSYDQEAHYRVLAADIEAILTVLRRRQRRYEKSNQRLNLHWADLHGAKLEGAHLQRVDLNEAYLWGANLDNAHLEGAQFMHSHLEGAQFSNSHLQGVDLRVGASGRGSLLGHATEWCAHAWRAPRWHVAGRRGPDACARTDSEAARFSYW